MPIPLAGATRNGRGGLLARVRLPALSAFGAGGDGLARLAAARRTEVVGRQVDRFDPADLPGVFADRLLSSYQLPLDRAELCRLVATGMADPTAPAARELDALLRSAPRVVVPPPPPEPPPNRLDLPADAAPPPAGSADFVLDCHTVAEPTANQHAVFDWLVERQQGVADRLVELAVASYRDRLADWGQYYDLRPGDAPFLPDPDDPAGVRRCLRVGYAVAHPRRWLLGLYVATAWDHDEEHPTGLGVVVADGSRWQDAGLEAIAGLAEWDDLDVNDFLDG